MSSRSSTPDPQQAAAQASEAFASMGAAGMDLFQEWLKVAGNAMPAMTGQAAGASGQTATGNLGNLGSMGGWSLPTMDPQELDKRIQDLRTVQFWLEQNARMIAMTIQGLEVQKMTLSTLQGMNVSMDALRDALKARNTAAATPAQPAPEPTPEPVADTPPDETAQAAQAAQAAQNDLINPMRWWDTLTQQFTHLAAQAAQPPQVTPMSPPKGGRRAGSSSSARKTSSTGTARSAPKNTAKPRAKGASAPRTTRGGKSSGGASD